MMRRNLHRLGLVSAATAAITMAVGGLALGTSGGGVVGEVTARGTADDKIKTRGNQSYDVVMQAITIQPAGHTGWHSHHGQAIVVIKSGTFTTYSAHDKSCAPHTYQAGDVYVDRGYGEVHIARNEGSEPLVLQITYLDVPVGAPFRIDADLPGNCAF